MRPEDMTTDRTGYSISATNPGTEQAAESAAALAAASIVFQPTDIEYAQLCFNHSKSVWDKVDMPWVSSPLTLYNVHLCFG